MWLQRGEVPEEYRSVKHLGGTLLNVANAAGLRYRDDARLDLSQCIGFTQHETLMVRLETEGLTKVTGTVLGLITPRSASVEIAHIAKGKLTKEVMRMQAHHYVVIPDAKHNKDKALCVKYYAKLWAVANHQPCLYKTDSWGGFLSYLLQYLFRMDHPTDRSVALESEQLLDWVMLRVSGKLPDAV